jgi:membrane-associated phospholipid phosphatase
MTLTVHSVLLSRQYTEAIPFLLCAMILLCWARIAAAYHYPSDLIAGIGIGVAVGVRRSLAFCFSWAQSLRNAG